MISSHGTGELHFSANRVFLPQNMRPTIQHVNVKGLPRCNMKGIL
jgi:hypothetical protein